MQQKSGLIIVLIVIVSFVKVSAQIAEKEFAKETKVGFKIGATVNFLNKRLHQNLNEDPSVKHYDPINSSYYVNPYLSVGVERHISKHFGLNFNMGFYQTLQKYKYTHTYVSIGTSTYGGLVKEESTVQYLNNNVFLELLPAYIYNGTQVFGGLNLSRYSPTVSSDVKRVDPKTGQTTILRLKDKPNESYHLYTVIGIQQTFSVNTCELTLSASYFGLFKKYDSGLTFAFGVLF